MPCSARWIFSPLTFQGAVTDSLLDLGLFHQVGGLFGEDELPKTRPEAVPVVFHHWDTVLWWRNSGKTSKYRDKKKTAAYLDVLALDHL